MDLNALKPGDRVTVTLEVTAKNAQSGVVTFECRPAHEHTTEVHVVRAAEPLETLAGAAAQPSASRYQHLIEMTRGLDPIRTAVVHPVDQNSLVGAIEAAKAKLIIPVLVGPEQRIRSAAELAGIDLSPYELVATKHSEAAALEAVVMARSGRVEALMKGALHTNELMRAVVDGGNGLRTGRRISHVFAIDAPRYHWPLFITDAAINISPTLNDKRDIVQNAIDLAHALGIAEPRVAILAAEEMVTEGIRSTVDAAALCKMAERGQIKGGILDGPLAFDNAVSMEAATTKGIVSPVAGRANILVVPDLEAGNMLAKQLEYLADAHIAGIVLGAQVPIILTSRADKTESRLGSSAIALLLVRQAKREGV